MTKQEKIQEKVAKWLFAFVCEREDLKLDWGQTKGYYLQEATLLLGLLSSQGIVIKVERELPNKEAVWDYRGRPEVYDDVKQSMLNAGFAAVEPLLKE